MKNIPAAQWCRVFLKQQVRPGDLCIDATAGNGYDTEFLCSLTGEKGRVLAFDIQEQALEQTRQRLERAGYACRASLILQGHEHMADYAREGTVSAAVFNFGYLPGGDHRLATRPETSLKALEAALGLLKEGGILCLCVYSGGDTGYAEKQALMDWLEKLDEKAYLAVRCQYCNRKKDAPLPVLVVKLRQYPCTQPSILL